MKNSGLDDEPPSTSEGKKEVNAKKRNDTNPPLVVFLTNKKNKKNSLEKKLIPKNKSEMDYIPVEGEFADSNLTLTNEIINFKNTSIDSAQLILSSYYSQRLTNINIAGRKQSAEFYAMNSSYSFIPQIKEENKKEDLPTLPKEREDEKENAYTLMYAPENEEEMATATQENLL